MNKTIYIRNLFVFVIFVAVIFVTPFVFAQVSSPSLIRLKTNQMKLHTYDNIDQVGFSLGASSVIQLPDEVAAEAEYINGQMDLRSTLINWIKLAQKNRTLPPRMGPNGRYLFPVKVVSDPNSKINPKSREAIGYLDLVQLSQNSNQFSTVRMDLQGESEPQKPTEPIVEDETVTGPQFYDEEVYGSSTVVEESSTSQTSEATTSGGDQQVDSYAPESGPRPIPRPFAARPEDLRDRESFLCNNTWDPRGYSSSNCLSKSYPDFKDHVQHVLSDLEAINQLRAPRIPIDPRFSICIGYKESNLSPNAVNNDSGGGAWGMFQVRNSTGREAIDAYGSVVNGYRQYDTGSEYNSFKQAMLKSTLAQADLHHSVILKKAEYAGLLQKLGNGSMSFNNYHNLAARYYGGAGRNTYANKIISCMRGMTELVSEFGQIAPGVTGNQLRNILKRVK